MESGVVGVGGGWMECGMVGGIPPPTHGHACMHTHAHIYTLNMIISIANGCPHCRNPGNYLH